jgi:hypothetical protein
LAPRNHQHGLRHCTAHPLPSVFESRTGYQAFLPPHLSVSTAIWTGLVRPARAENAQQTGSMPALFRTSRTSRSGPILVRGNREMRRHGSRDENRKRSPLFEGTVSESGPRAEAVSRLWYTSGPS